MERHPLLVVIVILLLLFGMFVVSALFGEAGPTKRSGGLKFRQGPRKEKTFVDNELYDKIAGSETVAGTDAPVSEETNAEQKANGQQGQAPATPEEAAAQEALNSLTPEQGIERLATLLATLENLEHAASLYTALGTLYAQEGESGAGPAEEAFAAAKKLARNNEDRHHATLAHVTALTARGDVESAMREAAAAGKGEPTTLSGLQLGIVRGRLHEQQNAPDEAEAAYKKAMEDAMAAETVFHGNALNVYRQACLSLVQLYRRTGREPAANSVVLKMKNDLARYHD